MDARISILFATTVFLFAAAGGQDRGPLPGCGTPTRPDAPGAAEGTFAARANCGIQTGLAFLRENQGNDGKFVGSEADGGDATALGVLTFLKQPQGGMALAPPSPSTS
ncbi:MAG: hypothetical protein EXR76_07680 [Myxococcales bacterium]|nr:hypothetical protein [Myxococcales bacterium]